MVSDLNYKVLELTLQVPDPQKRRRIWDLAEFKPWSWTYWVCQDVKFDWSGYRLVGWWRFIIIFNANMIHRAIIINKLVFVEMFLSVEKMKVLRFVVLNKNREMSEWESSLQQREKSLTSHLTHNMSFWTQNYF